MVKQLLISQAIKNHCRECCNNHNPRTNCVSVLCPLFPYKCGKKETDIVKMIDCTKDLILQKNLSKNWDILNKEEQTKAPSRLKTIKKYCKKCAYEGKVMQCELKNCFLYSFRLGKKQYFDKKVISPERKNVLIKNLHLYSGE